VDYLFHILIALAVLALCILLVQERSRARLADRQMELAAKNRKRRIRQEAEAANSADRLPNQKAVTKRELKKVPTPWGWAGSSAQWSALGGHPTSLRQRIERLRAEKRTVEDEEYRRRNSDALRSMVEDRYGHAPHPTKIKYSKVKPPRLRDPDLPHDQMDNFPSGRTGAIVGKLSQQPGGSQLGNSLGRRRKVAGLENIKKPWGW
jgi:hypothetical protein